MKCDYCNKPSVGNYGIPMMDDFVYQELCDDHVGEVGPIFRMRGLQSNVLSLAEEIEARRIEILIENQLDAGHETAPGEPVKVSLDQQVPIKTLRWLIDRFSSWDITYHNELTFIYTPR